MGKVYQFPNKKKAEDYKRPLYSENATFLKDLIEALIETYEEKIKELNQYKDDISRLHGKVLKSPKQVAKEVKSLHHQFLSYGISCNFFRFDTRNKLEILYYSESDNIYIVENEKLEDAKRISVGEFIREFEGYPFSLNIDDAVLRIFDTQINQLHITISTLKNTEV